MRLKDQNIICFAGEDWWFHNPHSNYHLMKVFAKQNRVLFVNSTGIKMPDFRSDKFAWKRVTNKLKSLARYLKKADHNLYVFTPLALPMIKGSRKALPWLNKTLLKLQLLAVMNILRLKDPIVWVTALPAQPVAAYLKKRGLAKCLVYYCVDNVPFYPGADREALLGLERAMQKEADLVLFVNHDLFEERKNGNQNTRYLGHGVDYGHFADPKSPAMPGPADLAGIRRPIAGYTGEINGLDFSLISYLAEQNPDISFVFIGDIYENLSRDGFSRNVHFMGKRPYEILPDYLHEMACCCLYYRMEDVFNDYRNPKKLLEYLAAGKPVVSVPIRQMKYFGEVVDVARDREEFNKLLRNAVSEGGQLRKDKRQNFARGQTWESIAKKASEYISDTLPAKGRL